MKSFSLICAAFALCICGSPQLRGEPMATVTFANNQSVVANSDGRVFELVGLQPNEVVDVRVQLSVEEAGRALRIESRDGGRLSSPGDALVVAGDGTITFRFQAGNSCGRYEVSLHDGADEIALQFYALDVANPQNNPPAITADNPHI